MGPDAATSRDVAADDLPAGEFATWAAATLEAIGSRSEVDVPCGACTACCTSSQFVHIAPDEVATLARIPPALLFPAPRLPAGHVVLGYDERGRCPMLGDRGCTIYEQRPRTCRTYDCRVFAAAGIDPGDAKPAIRERVARWRFSYVDRRSRPGHDAVRRAAAVLGGEPELLAAARVPADMTQVAALALELHGALLDTGPDADAGQVVRVEIRRRSPSPA